MVEITKDFIKFVAEVIALLIIFSVVFSPEGIASNTFNYFVFAEPILLQNYIASAMTVGSQVRGEFYSDIKLTSGLPHTVKILFKGGIPYVNVIPVQEAFLKTKFTPIEPVPIITSCSISEQEIKLPKKAGQVLRVEKIFENGKCKLILTLEAGLIPPPGNLSCSDGTLHGKCAFHNAPKYCDNGRLIDKCSICGCLPGGYACNVTTENCYRTAYELTVDTLIDLYNSPISDVPVTIRNIDLIYGLTKKTDSNGIVKFTLYPWINNVSVPPLVGTREFSHFWDRDCNSTNIGCYWDTSKNPYIFEMYNRDRHITALYKLFTKITNLNYKCNIISGKLLDEFNNAIIAGPGNYHPICEDPSTINPVPVNRNVTLEYFNSTDNSWNYIGVVDSLADGSWSLGWDCYKYTSATKLRATYIPTNWYYMPKSTEISITCSYELTVIAQIDVFSTSSSISPLSGVKVNVDGKINYTDSSGIVTYDLLPGVYDITVENPFDSRSFSHFWDSDCHQTDIGYWLDTESNPYTFGIYRCKNITAQYKAFTNITDSIGNPNTFEYNGTTIKGKLLDERGGALIDQGSKHPVCENSSTPSTPVLVDRNVTLEYYDSNDNSWHFINSTTATAAPLDGSWSLNWSWVSGATKLRANYTPINWFYVGTSVEISLYRLIVFTVLDIVSNPPVPNVQVNVDGVTKSSGASGEVMFFMNPGAHSIKVNSTVIDLLGSRNFSHFWDHDCNSLGDYLDTNVNPHTFTTWNKDRNITAFYKTFTYIKDSAGNKNKFEYDGATIKGKLQDERSNPIGQTAHKALVCGVAGTTNSMYRNITLEYYKNGNWYYIGSVETSTSDGSWSSDWICNCNTTKIRASYNHLDWYYNSISVEKDIDSSSCPCKLAVFTLLDITGTVVQNVQVNVDGITKSSSASGKVEFFMNPGVHSITVEDPKDSRSFSHFWDHDCDGSGTHYLDTSSNPFSFDMFGKDRNITAFYKTFTDITNFDYDGSTIVGKLLDESNLPIGETWHRHFSCDGYSTGPIDRSVTLEYYDGSWHYIDSVESSTTDGSWSYPWSCVPGATKLRASYNPLNWYYNYTSAEKPITCAVPSYILTFKAQVDATGQLLQGVQVNVDGAIKNTQADGTVTYQLSPRLHTMSVQSQSGSRIFSHFWDHDCDNFGNYYDTSGSPFGTYTFTMFNKDKNITAQYLTFTKITDTIGNPNTFEYDGTKISGKLLDEKNNVLLQTGGKAPTCGGLGTRISIDTNITLEYYDGSWHTIGSPKFFDDFNDGDYNGWTGVGTWSVTNGELSDSGSGGAEYINTNWNGWNSNNYVSVNIKLSGVDVWVKIFDGSNEYYFQTWNGYTDLHLWINGVHTKYVDLTGINPSNWNAWKIKQSGSTIEVYINDQKWMDYNSAPIITNGRIQLRTSNPTIAFFDDVNVDGVIYKKDGSWSYPWGCIAGTTKLRASYNPTNWYYNSTSSERTVSCAVPIPCRDSDRTNKITKGTCTDGSGSHEDYCIDNTHICEYVCNGVCRCMGDISCPLSSPYCNNGACVECIVDLHCRFGQRCCPGGICLSIAIPCPL